MFAEDLLESTFFPIFVRRYVKPFSARELQGEFRKVGLKFTISQLKEMLEDEPDVIPLEDGAYITRAGAFTGRTFSFVPTDKEVEQGVIVLGDRAIPFADPEMLYFEFTLAVGGSPLNSATFECDPNVVRDLFYLHDDEITDQIVAKDPATKDLNLDARDFELPRKFNLTGFDARGFFELSDFRKGDRIMAYVNNWDTGVIDIVPLKCVNPDAIVGIDFLRENWYECLENSLLAGFDKDGACDSIGAQLSNVFFDKKEELCNLTCGSVFEFLLRSKKVGLEYYGVESRLWRRGEEVPALLDGEYGAMIGEFYDVSPLLIDAFLKDEFFRAKKPVPLSEDTISKILPEGMDLDEETKRSLSLQIRDRNGRLQKSYNLFADFKFGEFRSSAIALLQEIRELYFSLDCREDEIPKFPQSELVAVAQFYLQTVDIIETVEMNAEATFNEMSVEDWLHVMEMSVDGMGNQLDYIRPILLDAYEQIKKERFSVI